MKQPRPRASDAQRTAVWEVLDSAFADGRLDHFEHFERTRTASRAKFVDELHPLIADLRGGDAGLGLDTAARTEAGAGTQRTGTDRGAGEQRRSRGLMVGIGVAVAALAVVGGIVVSAGTDGSSDSGSSSGSATSSFGPLFTSDGASQMLGEARAEFGVQPIDGFTIYGNRASLMREDPTEPGKRLSYQFRGDWEQTNFDSRTDSATFQITDVDPAEFLDSLAIAAEALGTDLEQTGHVFVSADVLGQPEYRVSVYEGDDISTVTVSSDGQVRRVSEG